MPVRPESHGREVDWAHLIAASQKSRVDMEGHVPLQLNVSAWVSRFLISNCRCALCSYWSVSVGFKFDREKVVGNCPSWASAMRALDPVAVLQGGLHSPGLNGCHSDKACNELLSFESFLNSASIVQLPLIYYQQVQRLKCLWLCFSADVFFSPRAYHVSLAQLLSGSFLQHLLHPISCAVPYGNSYAGSPFRCLLRNSQAPVKATQNPSIRYLSDCIMDIMDHICISYHWIVLSTANFGCRFSQEQMSFSMACAALTSPLVPHGNWEADTIFSAGYSDCQFFLEMV